MPPKVIFMIIGTVILMTGGYFLTLYAIHGFDPDFLAINQCLESGGKWNYDRRQCEKIDYQVIQDM